MTNELLTAPNHEAMPIVSLDIDTLRAEHDLGESVQFIEAERKVDEARLAHDALISVAPESQHDHTTADYIHDVEELEDPFGELPRALAIGAEELRMHPMDAPETAAELFDAPTEQLGAVLHDVELVEGDDVVEEIIEAIERTNPDTEVVESGI